jgi:hypothetical protein
VCYHRRRSPAVTPLKIFLSYTSLGRFDPSLQNVTINLVSENPTDKSWWIGFNNRTAGQYFPGRNKFEAVDMNKAIAASDGQLPAGISQFRFQHDTVFFCTREWYLVRICKTAYIKSHTPRLFNCREHL